jgi:hypothetical protein
MTLSMADRGRRLIAERINWPAGAAVACEELEARRPGWTVVWFHRNTAPGFEREPGFYAWPAGVEPMSNGRRRTERYGATAELLLVALP